MKIKFKRDTSFRKQFFVPDSFAHPAKMDAQLLIWIVEHYTEAGETILDPMAGSGTTMLACILGRDVVLVELEEKFCKMMWDNWEQVRMRPQLGSTMGTCEIIQGDSRDLQNILFPIPFEEMVLALSIGDGYLLIHPNGVTPTLGITHSAKQEAYFNYKCSLLDNIGLTYRRYERERERAGKSHKSLIADTTVDERLVPIHKLLYPAGKKAITAELLNKVTPFILAHWFMDDGSSQKGNTITLSTESHTEHEVTLLADWFRSRYAISPSVRKHGTGYILYFHKADAFALANLLRPYFHPSLLYKMDIPVAERSNARQLEGLVDKIVTSPPFAEVSHHSDDASGMRDFTPGRTGRVGGTAGNSKGQIGQLPYGEIDKCIFSPPYEASVNVPDSKQEARAERLRKAGYDPKKYQGGKGRNLQQDWSYGQIDKIVTSPPYEGSISDGAGNFEWTKREWNKSEWGQFAKNHTTGYGKSGNNIGNLKSQSYLEAMLQVYQQCYKVLKPEGLMILVTKNFIRNKQVVRLDEDTIKLCEQAGFCFVERHYRELPSQSFWRVIYHQKFPSVEQIKNEDVLVFSRQ